MVFPWGAAPAQAESPTMPAPDRHVTGSVVWRGFDHYQLDFAQGGADVRSTPQQAVDPAAHELEAIASCYSLCFPEVLENLKHQFEVYDSLYAWCWLEVAKVE